DPSQYLAAGSALQPYDLAQHMQYNVPYERRGAGGSLQYELSRHLIVALEGRWSDNDMVMTREPISGVAGLPANAAGNPFDVPVRLQKIFFDLPRARTYAQSANYSGLFSLSGDLIGEWRYRAGASMSDARTGSRTV